MDKNRIRCVRGGRFAIEATAAHLRTAWPAIREQLRAGAYRPMPVRRAAIPKPDGGERELGIPTMGYGTVVGERGVSLSGG